MSDLEGIFGAVIAVYVIYYLLRIVGGGMFPKGQKGFHPDK